MIKNVTRLTAGDREAKNGGALLDFCQAELEAGDALGVAAGASRDEGLPAVRAKPGVHGRDLLRAKDEVSSDLQRGTSDAARTEALASSEHSDETPAPLASRKSLAKGVKQREKSDRRRRRSVSRRDVREVKGDATGSIKRVLDAEESVAPD